VWWILKRFWQLTVNDLFPLLKKGYHRIPNRPIVAAGLIGVLLLGVTTTVLISKLLSPSTVDESYAMKKPNLRALKILNGNLGEQQAATREILNHVGFEVVEGDDHPSGNSWYMLPSEITYLTDDASRKSTGGRMTLVQFTNML